MEFLVGTVHDVYHDQKYAKYDDDELLCAQLTQLAYLASVC